MHDDIRVLLLADSHIGFDLPVRPRVERRRRGHDFLRNLATALAPAVAGEVDAVVHAGDVFDRPRVSPGVARLAYEPLLRVANRGIPVFVVPGNHERSRLPHARLAVHPHVHVFDRPRSFVLEVRGRRVAFAGFPYERRVRARFPELLEQTGWREAGGALRLLCMHHCVEGATVGPGNFTFTTANDVIRGGDIPDAFAAVLSGHVHRHQVLTADLRGRPLAARVLYPGSIERTSSAEVGETKGYVIVRVGPEAKPELQWQFRPLYARPMIRRRLGLDELSASEMETSLRTIIEEAPGDAVLLIRVEGRATPAHLRGLSAERLRRLVPETMNLELRLADLAARRPPRTASQRPDNRASAPRSAVQLEVSFE